MSNDNLRQDSATTADLSRPVATRDDSEYSLSIDEALALYEAAGLPRTTRSVQRYCAKGDLDAHRIETPFGEKFLIKPASVDRHIAYINEVRLVATGRDLPRQVATSNDTESQEEKPTSGGAATGGDNQRLAATTSDVSYPVAVPAEPVSRLVAVEGAMIEQLKGENAFLRGQITVKDEQIKDLTERARETNHLIGGLQKMLTPLLGRGQATRAAEGTPAYEHDVEHSDQ